MKKKKEQEEGKNKSFCFALLIMFSFFCKKLSRYEIILWVCLFANHLYLNLLHVFIYIYNLFDVDNIHNICIFILTMIIHSAYHTQIPRSNLFDSQQRVYCILPVEPAHDTCFIAWRYLRPIDQMFEIPIPNILRFL